MFASHTCHNTRSGFSFKNCLLCPPVRYGVLRLIMFKKGCHPEGGYRSKFRFEQESTSSQYADM